VFVSDLEGKILQANDAVSHSWASARTRCSSSRSRASSAPRRPRSSRRRCGSGRARRHPQRPAQPPERERAGYSHHPQRLRPAQSRRQGDRGHRHPARHARAGQGPGLRGELDQECARPGLRLRPRGQDPAGQRRVLQLLGFRQDEVLEQSLSRFISPEETREFTAACARSSSAASLATPGSTPQRARRGHPHHPQRLGPPATPTAGDRRHRHPARHAGLRASSGATSSSPRRSCRRRSGPGEVRGGRGGPRAEDDRPRKRSWRACGRSRKARAWRV